MMSDKSERLVVWPALDAASSSPRSSPPEHISSQFRLLSRPTVSEPLDKSFSRRARHSIPMSRQANHSAAQIPVPAARAEHAFMPAPKEAHRYTNKNKGPPSAYVCVPTRGRSTFSFHGVSPSWQSRVFPENDVLEARAFC